MAKDEHAIHIDYTGNVWISSAGGPRLREKTANQILKFTKSGKFLIQIGHRGDHALISHLRTFPTGDERSSR